MTKPIEIITTVRRGIPEIDVDEVRRHGINLKLIDVRQPDEFNAELGHIKGATLVTLGPPLQDFLNNHKDKKELIVFICRSGNRSGTATLMARDLGFNETYNMTGGMIRWNEYEYPVERQEG